MVSDRAKRLALPVSLAILAALSSAGWQPVAFADPGNTCISGFVWRAARPGDAVCVSPGVRDTTAQENQLAAQRVDPNGGPYGPDTCLQGFVWREAFDGDHVCAPPGSRTQAANDNAAAASRIAANAPAAPAPCVSNPLPGFLPSSNGMFC
jgi:hypothetical protein